MIRPIALLLAACALAISPCLKAADGPRVLGERSGSRLAWYVIPGGTWRSNNVFAGDIYRTSGPAANAAAFNSSAVGVVKVGQGTLTFTDSSNGTFAFTIDGVSGTKSISRQSF